MRLLLLGGTRDARRAAEALSSTHQVLFSLAGRVDATPPLGATLRIGGFGGVEGLAGYLDKERIDAVLNAAHPFARQMSANAMAAAARLGTPYARLLRPPWRPAPGDDWSAVSDLEAAARAPSPGERVFIALGRVGSEVFAERGDLWRAVRVAEPGPAILWADHVEIGAPGDATAQAELFTRLAVQRLVLRNSGGAAGAETLEAARSLSLSVTMIERPPTGAGRVVSSVGAALRWAEEIGRAV